MTSELRAVNKILRDLVKAMANPLHLVNLETKAR